MIIDLLSWSIFQVMKQAKKTKHPKGSNFNHDQQIAVNKKEVEASTIHNSSE